MPRTLTAKIEQIEKISTQLDDVELLEELLQQKERLQSQSKKIGKNRKQRQLWIKPKDYQLVGIDEPVEIKGDFKRQKYGIRIHYKNNDVSGFQIDDKYIKFGYKPIQDFVDHNNIKKKETMLAKLKYSDDPFHSNFYRKRLLNGPYSDLENNYLDLLQNFIRNTKLSVKNINQDDCS